MELSPAVSGYVIPKLVHPLVHRLQLRWIWSRGRRYAVYMKLDPVKVEWTVKERLKGRRNMAVASSMGVSTRMAQEILSEYGRTKEFPPLRKPGRKEVEATAVKASCLKLLKKGAAQKAEVAAARKMACVVWGVLSAKKPYVEEAKPLTAPK